MVSEFAPRVRKRRIFIRVGIAAAAVAVLGTAVAFKAIFDRPGETALRLVPADALMVGSIDLSPSPNQAMVFKKIDDALARHGLDKQIDGALTDVVAQGPAAEKIRPYSKRGGAFAMLKPDPKNKEDGMEDSFVAYFAVSDGPAVAKILRESGKPAFWKGTRYHQLNPSGPGMMVVDDLLVVGMGKALHQVEQVVEKKKDSILERPDFMVERSKIDPDANIMVFISPEALEVFGKDAPEESREMLKASKWMAMGIAVRENGLALSFSSDYDSTKAKWLQPLASMAPIRNDLLSVLPKGAYGFTALSQPSKYFESFELAVQNDKQGRQSMAEWEKEMSKETGVSLRQDVLPAFQGNAIIAFYPNPNEKNAAGADLLLVVDDQQGARAANLAEHIRNQVESEILAQGEESPFEMTEEGDVKKFRLIDSVTDEMQTDLTEGMGDSSPLKSDVLMKDKTITWALVGQTVVASSSQKLLDAAIAGLKTRENGLETDALWQGRTRSLIQGQQVLATFNLARIAEGFQNSVDIEKTGEDGKTIREVSDSFKKLTEPFVIKSATSTDSTSMDLFIPMDWERLIDLIGENMNQREDR